MEWRIIVSVLCLIATAATAQNVTSAPLNQTVAAPTNQTVAAPTNQTVAAPTNQTVAAPTNQTVAAPTNQTAAPTTTAPPLAKINLLFKIVQEFKESYSNFSNPETIELTKNITSACSPVYQKRFSKFLRMTIQKFSKGSIAVDSILEFDSTNASSTPSLAEVTDTLKAAISNGSLGIPVDNTSISATNVLDNGTTPAANTSVTISVPTISDIAAYNISFKMNEVFSNDLSNMTSALAIKLATNVTTEVIRYYGGLNTFKYYFVKRFSNGSIVVDSELGLVKNGSTPLLADLATGLANAVRNGIVKLTIDPKSITVTDSTGKTANRSPVLASMLTALWMTLASLLFSAVMH